MSEKILVVPNTLKSAIEFAEVLDMGGVIRDHTARLLQYLYVRGWDDGFVPFDSSEIQQELLLTDAQLLEAVSELRTHNVIELRPAGRAPVAGLVALSSPDSTGFSD